MNKGPYDRTTLDEVVGMLLSERTEKGDSIKLTIKYNGEKKPTLTLQFSSFSPEKQDLPKEEDISDWLPNSYNWFETDSMGETVGDYKVGFDSWQQMFRAGDGIGVTIQNIVEFGGRRFSYEEKL